MSKTSVDACSISVREKFKGSMTDDEVEFLSDKIRQIDDMAYKTGKDSRQFIKEFIQQQEMELKVRQLQRIETLNAVNRNLPSIENSADPIKALRAFIGDFTASKDPLPVSPMYTNKQNISDRMNSVFNWVESKAPGTVKWMQSKDPRLLQAVGRYVDGNKELLAQMDLSPEEMLSVSTLSDAIRKSMDDLRQQKISVGFNVPERENYMGRQRYPAKNLREMGMEKFREIALKRMDFAGLDAQDKIELVDKLFLDRSIDDLRSPWEINDDATKVVRLTSGKRIEKNRSITFKSTEDFLMFNQETGQNYFENITRDYSQDAGEIAAAQTFGTQSRLGFEKLLAATIEKEKALGRTKNLKQLEAHLRDDFEFGMRGPDYMEENIVARVGRGVRQLTDMAKLGSSFFSTFPDMGIASGVFGAVNGKNILQAAGDHITQHFKYLFNSEKGRKIAAQIGIYADDNIFELAGSRAAEGVGPLEGFLDKAHHNFMKLNLLSKSDLAGKRAMVVNQARVVAELSDKSFNSLGEEFKSVAKRYGFNESNWEIMKHGVMELDDGTKAVSIEAIRDMDLEVFPGATVAEKRRARIELTASLGSFYRRMAEAGIVTAPLNYKRFVASFDTNTVTGQAVRMALQYKTVPISVLKSLDFIRSTGGGKYGNIKALSYTAGTAIAMSALSFYAKQYAINGKKPEEVGFGSKEMLGVFAQSGVGGLYADFLLNDRPFLETLAGPTLGGSIADASHLVQQTLKESRGDQVYNRKGFRSNLQKEFWDAAKRNSPTVPYLKNILTLPIYERIQEMVD